MDNLLSIFERNDATCMAPKDFTKMLMTLEPDLFDAAYCEQLVRQLGTDDKGQIAIKDVLATDNSSTSKAKPTHVAIVGAGFVGTFTAYALAMRATGALITLTDVNDKKCIGEVDDLEDSGAKIKMATPKEAGQADIIVVTAGRGQKEGETRLDLLKANAAIMESIVNGMKPIKKSAKMIIVSNPCDALTFKVQEISGLPTNQVMGSGTLLDSRRLRIELAYKLGVNHSSITLFVLGEHGDSQFAATSLAKVGVRPLLQHDKMKGVDMKELGDLAKYKAYDIIAKKRYTAFGVSTCVEKIVESILFNKRIVLPVTVRVPGRQCCMSMPASIGINGIESIENIFPYLTADEQTLWDSGVAHMETAVKVMRGEMDTKSVADASASKREVVCRGHRVKFEPPEGGQVPVHVAIVGAGFVGTTAAYAMLVRGTGAKVTLTDMFEAKCQAEVLDLEDTGGSVDMATTQEAGQADVIVISAGRGQKEGETRLDLIKANAGIMRAVIKGMQPIKKTAKIVVVSNPCDALTFVAQEASGLPLNQVIGSGTVLDSNRLKVELGQALNVSSASVNLYVLGEHGDGQFPCPSCADIGGIPLKRWPGMDKVDLLSMAKHTGKKAYDIIQAKGYTSFGVATAIQTIVDCIINDRDIVMPVSVRVPGAKCCMSLPCVVGIKGANDIMDVAPNLDAWEMQKYQENIANMEKAAAMAMEGA